MAKQKIDWNRVKKDFLFNKNASLKDVATKYDISYGYIRKISMNKGWVADKRQFWKQADGIIMKEIERLITEKVKENCKMNFQEKYESNN